MKGVPGTHFRTCDQSLQPMGISAMIERMRRCLISLVALLCLPNTPRAATAPTADFPAAPPRVEGSVYRDRLRPNWLKDGSNFWYRVVTGASTHQFVLADATKGERRPAFNHEEVAAALRGAGIKDASADKLPIESPEFDLAGGSMNFKAGGKPWSWNFASKKLEAAPPSTNSSMAGLEPRLRTASRASTRTGGETSVRFINRLSDPIEIFWLGTDGQRQSYAKLKPGEEHDQHTFAGHVWAVMSEGKEVLVLQADEEPATIEVSAGMQSTPTPRRANSPREPRPRRAGSDVSPDARWRAVLRESNVYLQPMNGDSTNAIALTSDGTPKDGYSGRVYWSPDSSRLVVMRTQPVDEREVTLVESSPADQLQPKIIRFPYAKPGDKLPVSKPHLFEVASRNRVIVEDKLFENPWSITDVRWSAASDRFTFLYNQRGHQVLRVVAVDAKTGAASAIIEETSPTFIDYSGKFFCEYLDETGEILWMSERDGWNHLYLYDARTGAVKRQVTQGEWVVREVERVDKDKREVWFRAGGLYEGQDPYYVQYARASLDSGKIVKLTEGDGSHNVQFSPDRSVFVDTYSRVDMPPHTEFRRSSDGSLICALEVADISALKATGWRAPERFVAKGRDGTTDIYGIIHFPKNYDPQKSYPVVESIYAGPQGAFVPKSFSRNYGTDNLSALGFFVVQIDGMGTSYRSKKFHDVCWKNLGDAGLPDRMLWIRAAAAQHKGMDLSRVGIFGTSAGGQSALRALLAHGDFYKAGVADSGCHDNRMDKIWWNEQWMGWPVGPHYDEQSNVTQAHKLKGRLLLMAGELDRNVDPSSTMQVVNALIKANRDFELLMVPGAGHGILSSQYGQAKLREFFVRTLRPSGS